MTLDAGFAINVLNRFPGTFVKYVNNWLSEEKILTLLGGKDDRSAYFLMRYLNREEQETYWGDGGWPAMVQFLAER